VIVLTELEERLADAHALAVAAGAVIAQVIERLDDVDLRRELRALAEDAVETRARCLALEARYDDDTATALLHHVESTRNRAADLAGAWFRAGTGPLAAWTFLAMGEAGEVAAWRAVTVLAARAGDVELQALGSWALGVQERHLELALAGSTRLAEASDPSAPRWG